MSKAGSQLPKGTVIYFAGSMLNGIVWRSEVRTDRWFQYLELIFDPKDGLWATDFTRRIWKEFPHRHPHCSLFEMLYKKL
jgi:hypothetical protein